MSFARFFFGAVICTVLFLLYINLQIQTIELAYEGKKKEKRIHELVEENSNLTYAILKLKSVDHVGVQALAGDSGLKFADPGNVVEIGVSDAFLADGGFDPAILEEADSESPLISLLNPGQ